MNTDYLSVASHDAFRYGGLGKSAAEAYWFLQKYGPMTEQELSDRSGRSLRTTHRVLLKMSQMVDTTTGELIHMVDYDGLRWQANTVDLDQVAMIVGTAGTGRRQRAQHRREREIRRETLAVLKRSQHTNLATGQKEGNDAQAL